MHAVVTVRAQFCFELRAACGITQGRHCTGHGPSIVGLCTYVVGLSPHPPLLGAPAPFLEAEPLRCQEPLATAVHVCNTAVDEPLRQPLRSALQPSAVLVS